MVSQSWMLPEVLHASEAAENVDLEFSQGHWRLPSASLWWHCIGSLGRHLASTPGVLLLAYQCMSVVLQVIAFYTRCSRTNNHTVREAACTCIAELASKIDPDAVRPHVAAMLRTLITCLRDDSWPVCCHPRNFACLMAPPPYIQCCTKVLARNWFIPSWLQETIFGRHQVCWDGQHLSIAVKRIGCWSCYSLCTAFGQRIPDCKQRDLCGKTRPAVGENVFAVRRQVRDRALLAAGRCALAFPAECSPFLTDLYRLWMAHLDDNIYSVREDAAVALGDAVRVYRQEALDKLLPWLR